MCVRVCVRTGETDESWLSRVKHPGLKQAVESSELSFQPQEKMCLLHLPEENYANENITKYWKK